MVNTAESKAHMTVLLQFSVKPLKMNILGALVLQVLHLVRDMVDYVTDTVFRFLNEGKSEPLPTIKNSLLLQPAQKLALWIRNQQIKSEDVVTAYIDRIKQINPIVNAVVDNRFDKAIEEAKNVDNQIASGTKTVEEIAEETPFLGVPFTVKDNFQVTGLRQTVGLVSRKNAVSKENAAVVDLMEKAGAIPLGVTNLSELCTWWESSNCVYGRTRNPYDTTRIVGGSSGGEGCILGAAGSVVGIGSDVGGSIRMPAFFNGVFGHKPSMGVVSNVGQKPDLSDELQSYLVTGPMCRYASDLIPMFQVLAGPNAHKLKLDQKVNFKNIKIYYMEDDGGFPLVSRVHPELRRAQRQVLLYLERTYGLKTKKVHFPSMVRALEMWSYLMLGLHKRSFCEEMTNGKGAFKILLELAKWPLGLSSHTLPALMVGFFECLGIGKNQYMNEYMAQTRTKLQQSFEEMLGDDGIFLYPSHPTPAPYHNQPLFQPANFVYAAVFNVLGLPVTQCPLGLGTEGLPLGIQVAASLYNDHLCLAMANELEKGFGGWVPPSPVS